MMFKGRCQTPDAIMEAYQNGDLTDENLINYVCPDM